MERSLETYHKWSAPRDHQFLEFAASWTAPTRLIYSQSQSSQFVSLKYQYCGIYVAYALTDKKEVNLIAFLMHIGSFANSWRKQPRLVQSVKPPWPRLLRALKKPPQVSVLSYTFVVTFLSSVLSVPMWAFANILDTCEKNICTLVFQAVLLATMTWRCLQTAAGMTATSGGSSSVR